jgi:AcrR family transcriptional regulator
VHAAAHELLGEKGFESLTMRGLAQRLDVAPNALYSHVPSKLALIDTLIDDVLAQVEAPTPDAAEPRAGLHALMASTYDVLLGHPDLVPLYLARSGARGPNAQRLGGVVTALLGRAGVTGAGAAAALHVLIVYTIGFAAFTTRPPIEISGDARQRAEEMRVNFDSGLRWLLEGIMVHPIALRA